MSPSWRERAAVFVGDDEVRLRVGKGEVRTAPVARAGAAAVADALRALLQGVALKRAQVEVTLSSQLVRYALVPDADVLRNDAERQAAAAHALSQTYGELARGWQVAADRGGAFGNMLAAGLDPELRASIEAVLREAGAASVSVQPALARAVNASAREWKKATGWLAVVEPRRIVLLALASGSVVALRSQRVRARLAEELEVMLQQGRVLDGLPAEAADVIVCGEGFTGQDVPARFVPVDWTAPGQARFGADPLQLEFAQQARRLSTPELAALAVGGMLLAAAAWQYGDIAGERAALRSTLADADRFSRRQVAPALDTSRAEGRALAADVARANAVAARLNVPWDTLFTDLELAAGDGIVLVGFEPEGGMRRLRISGEARNFEDLTQYLRRLEGTPALQNVFLTAHEQRDRGLTFTLTADWVQNHGIPRP